MSVNYESIGRPSNPKLAGGALIVCGLLLLFIAIPELNRAFASAHWPMTLGTITTSTVDLRRTHGSRASIASYVYEAVVAYTYSVDDKTYTSKRISSGQYSSTYPEHAKSITHQYPVGASVNVYYDPFHPENAFLEPGFQWLALAPLIASLALFVVGTIFIRLKPINSQTT